MADNVENITGELEEQLNSDPPARNLQKISGRTQTGDSNMAIVSDKIKQNKFKKKCVKSNSGKPVPSHSMPSMRSYVERWKKLDEEGEGASSGSDGWSSWNNKWKNSNFDFSENSANEEKWSDWESDKLSHNQVVEQSRDEDSDTNPEDGYSTLSESEEQPANN